MVQENPDKTSAVLSRTLSTTLSSTRPGNELDKNYNPKHRPNSYPSDTVAAVTIAVLAVIVIITMLIVFRALRKRQRARRGERFGESVIPTVTTGVMGSGKHSADLKKKLYLFNCCFGVMKFCWTFSNYTWYWQFQIQSHGSQKSITGALVFKYRKPIKSSVEFNSLIIWFDWSV